MNDLLPLGETPGTPVRGLVAEEPPAGWRFRIPRDYLG